MPYDVTTITVQPNTHGKALPHVEQWLKANPRKGEFIGCLANEIGDLNTILLLHHYTNEADMIADRDQLAKSANPFGCVELITAMSADTYRDVSVHRPDQAGAIRPDLRGPHLSVQAGRPRPDAEGLGRGRAGAAEALADPGGDVFGQRRYDALHAHLALSEPRSARRHPQDRDRYRRLAAQGGPASPAHHAQRHLSSGARSRLFVRTKSGTWPAPPHFRDQKTPKARTPCLYTQLGLYIDGKWNHGNGGGGEDVHQPGDRRSRSPICRTRRRAISTRRSPPRRRVSSCGRSKSAYDRGRIIKKAADLMRERADQHRARR